MATASSRRGVLTKTRASVWPINGPHRKTRQPAVAHCRAERIIRPTQAVMNEKLHLLPARVPLPPGLARCDLTIT